MEKYTARICEGGAYKSASILGTATLDFSKNGRSVLLEDKSIFSMQLTET